MSDDQDKTTSELISRAVKGDIEAILALSEDYAHGGDSLRWLVAGAIMGNSEAISNLASWYWINSFNFGNTGKFEKIEPVAYLLYQKAAEMGHAPSMRSLGRIYENGMTGIADKDINKAIYWHKRAAENGEGESYYALARIYAYSLNIYDEAVKYYQMAAEHDVEKAARDLALSYESGDWGLTKSSEKAFEYYKIAAAITERKVKSCSHNSSSDLYFMELADCYENGRGCEINSHLAFENYLQAAELDNPDAMEKVIECYSEGIGVEKDDNLAAIWQKKSDEHLAALEALIDKLYEERAQPEDGETGAAGK